MSLRDLAVDILYVIGLTALAAVVFVLVVAGLLSFGPVLF